MCTFQANLDLEVSFFVSAKLPFYFMIWCHSVRMYGYFIFFKNLIDSNDDRLLLKLTVGMKLSVQALYYYCANVVSIMIPFRKPLLCQTRKGFFDFHIV